MECHQVKIHLFNSYSMGSNKVPNKDGEVKHRGSRMGVIKRTPNF